MRLKYKGSSKYIKLFAFLSFFVSINLQNIKIKRMSEIIWSEAKEGQSNKNNNHYYSHENRIEEKRSSKNTMKSNRYAIFENIVIRESDRKRGNEYDLLWTEQWMEYYVRLRRRLRLRREAFGEEQPQLWVYQNAQTRMGLVYIYAQAKVMWGLRREN